MPSIKDDHFIPLPVLDTSRSPSSYEAIRKKLANSTGRDYWRSLDELAQTEEFQDYVQHEFPSGIEVWKEAISRRTFLKLMSASFALAMFSGCRRPLEKIIPYNQAPEELLPGQPLYYATSLPWRGYARGVLVENHMGRPTKIEGNPQHPDSLGATDIFMQAATLEFYDPDRSQGFMNNDVARTWEDFLVDLQGALKAQTAKRGGGLRILTETVTSPTLLAQLQEVLRRFPDARWASYEPITRDHLFEGTRLAFGRMVEPHYRISEADVILALDSDFLFGEPGSLRYDREFAERRNPNGSRPMNRLYSAEPCPTITGTCADHRLPLRSDGVVALAWRLGEELGLPVPSSAALGGSDSVKKWIRAVANDLKAHRGTGLIIAGESMPPEVHALAHLMNERLGNTGRTVVYTDPIEPNPGNQIAHLRELTNEMASGAVDFLLMIGGNPAFNAPADIDFAKALGQVGLSVHLALYEDETSELCHWHLPMAHPLESWSDLRAYDGTASLVQPLIEPLYEGKTAHEVLSAFTGYVSASSHDIVMGHWRGQALIGFDDAWQKALHDGLIGGTASPTRSVAVRPDIETVLRFPSAGPLPNYDIPVYGSPGGGVGEEFIPPSSPYVSGSPPPPAYPTPAPLPFEVVFKPDPSIWDGRFVNNGWLQECPKPITKMTWDNTIFVSPALAERMGLKTQDVVELTLDGRAIQGAIFVVAGHADQSFTVFMGYGRTKTGRTGKGTGFNVYPLRSTRTLWYGSDVKIRRTGETYILATTQNHYTMQGRDLIRDATHSEFQKTPDFAKKLETNPTSKDTLYHYTEPPQSKDYAWAMGIDLNLCIGCNACVVACQAENNIPVVGKEQTRDGRHMHWIRVDRYFKGNIENPQSFNQPLPCMHCEDAPCEVVCPVDATQHDDEGLNEMLYNRCIGTRYCSNNCPYKVRRFNFLYYSDYMHEKPLPMLQNPDVTVRYRGVMEKCTYCVQRINAAKIKAEEEGRIVKDGEIVPACMQACPTRTISFGNLLDKGSNVSKAKADPRDYPLLSELGTRPRTTYQAKITNPNPELA